jgi:hypothetical protein
MAVSRFILDQSQLNNVDFGLDGFSPAFTLNTSTLDSIAKLDGFTFTTTVTASAGLGGLASSASALVSHRVTAGAVLGGLVGAASASVSNVVSAQAVLGGVVGSASATVIHRVSADAALGAGVGSATASVLNVVSAQAVLGGLSANANANVSGVVTASASLGGLVAVADATVDPAPTPPPAQYPGGNPWYRRPQVVQQPKVEEVVQVVVEPLRVPLQVFGVGASVGSLSSSAVAEVTWSILEDEAELLLLV